MARLKLKFKKVLVAIRNGLNYSEIGVLYHVSKSTVRNFVIADQYLLKAYKSHKQTRVNRQAVQRDLQSQLTLGFI